MPAPYGAVAQKANHDLVFDVHSHRGRSESIHHNAALRRPVAWFLFPNPGSPRHQRSREQSGTVETTRPAFLEESGKLTAEYDANE